MLKGSRIRHFELIESLPGGNMSEVWRAKDKFLSREVILKFLKPELTSQPEATQRFINEAKAASSLEHRNICTIYEVGTAESGDLFIAMAYYPGQTLRELIQEGPLPFDEVLDITSQLAEGLEKAHQNSIVHRDIKPANIILHDGEVKILDFGLALLKSQESEISSPRQTVGTIAYMSPEQARGEEVDHRSDIWSLGVVVYEMLTGSRPFQGEYPAAVIYSILNEDAAPIHVRGTRKRRILNEAVQKALSKPVDQRYDSVREFAADLKKSLEPSPVLQLVRVASLFVVALAILIVLYPGVSDPLLKMLGIPVQPQERRVAVLPFGNSCPTEAGQQPFIEGLPHFLEDELLGLSETVQTLKIIPSDFLSNDPLDAGRELGVNLVVLGKLICEGENGSIDLSLVNVEEDWLVENARVYGNLTNRNELINRTRRKVRELLRLRIEEPLQGVLAAAPDLQGLFLEGKGYLARSADPETIRLAIDRFEQVIEQAPDYAAAHAGLAQAFRHLYRHEPRSEYIKRSTHEADLAISLDSTNPESWVGKGLIVLEFGQWEESLQAFDRALELAPNSVRVLRGRAMALATANRPKEALEAFELAIQLEPEDWATHRDLAKFYLARGEYDSAIASFRKVTEQLPESLSAAENLAVGYFRNAQYDQAEEILLQNHSTSQGHNLLGTWHYFDGRYEDAAEQYTLALELEDSDWTLWSNLAGTLRLLERHDEADDAYREALQRISEHFEEDPEDPEHILDYADYLYELERYDECLELLERAAQFPALDSNPWLICLMGQIYEKLGSREEAIFWVLKAREKGYPLKSINESPTLAELVQDPEWIRRSAEISEE